MHPQAEVFPRAFALLDRPGFDRRLASWKERFWLLTGIPHPGTPGFEARMHAFEEWILLEDDPVGPGVPPVEEAARPGSLLAPLVREGRFDAPTEAAARALLAAQPGLWVLMAPWRKDAWFRDLLSGIDLVLDEGPPVPGLAPGQILQARLFALEGRTWAGLGRLVHPLAATETIHRLTGRWNAAGRSRPEILHLLAKLAWRADHYPRHAPEAFYELSHPLVKDLVSGDQARFNV